MGKLGDFHAPAPTVAYPVFLFRDYIAIDLLSLHERYVASGSQQGSTSRIGRKVHVLIGKLLQQNAVSTIDHSLQGSKA